MNRIKDRLIELGQESPDNLLAHPKNWRLHPYHQKKALLQVLDNVGWIAPVIVNRTTGHLLDGHLRVIIAMERDEPSIPVLYVAISEMEEQTILATFDPIRSLAISDHNLFSKLF